MSCILTAGHQIGCSDGIGGVKTIYLGNFNNNTTYTYNSDNEITGITSGATYYTFEVPNESAGFTETLNKSVENETLFFEQTVTFPINGYTAAERNLMLLIAKAEMTAILKLQSGKYILLGKVNGLNTTAGEGGSGTAYGDRLGINFTITGKEKENSNIVTDSAFASLTVV